MQDKILIGNVSKAQGIKGEVKVTIISEERDIFRRIKRVTVGSTDYEVESVKNLSTGIFFKLRGIDDRNSAEMLRGSKVYCLREDMPALPKGRYLVTDLLGSTILVDGEKVGVLDDILQNGSADVYCVKGERNFMFPCLKRALKRVSVEDSVIELHGDVLREIAVYED